MEERRLRLHENAQANLMRAKRQSSSEVDGSICRMSFTEDDDDGSLTTTFNLNDDVDNRPQKNLNESIDDRLNSNIATEFTKLNLNEDDVENEYNRLKDAQTIREGLICKSSTMKSRFGHPSDSSIQNLLYSDYENRNIYTKADDVLLCSDRKAESSISVSSRNNNIVGGEQEEELELAQTLSPDSPNSESAPFGFSYTKSFPGLDDHPDAALMSSRMPSIKTLENDDDISACLNLPLSILLQRSLHKVIYTQVSLVNKSVIDYFTTELRVNEHFKALRNFLFLHDGEFGHTLGEQLFHEISVCPSPAHVLNPTTLNNLLSRSMAALLGDSLFADNLSFTVAAPVACGEDVLGLLDRLQLSYEVSWPLSILITDRDLVRYNKVFAFMMKIKYSVWSLNDVFFHLKRQAVDRSPQFRQLQIFRHEMQHFARVLQSYVVSQVLLVTWQEFQRKLNTDVRNIDEMRRAHSVYLHEACFKCLLNEKAAFIMKIVHDIFQQILRFRTLLVSYRWERNPCTDFTEHPKFQALMLIYKEFQRYAKFLCKGSFSLIFPVFCIWVSSSKHRGLPKECNTGAQSRKALFGMNYIRT